MPFTHIDKGPGDLIRSADWNAMGQEIQRLATDKLDRAGGDAVAGPLAVRGDLSVGLANKGAGLRVFKKQEDGTAADHGAVVLGTDGDASARLHLGYAGPYSWIQSQGKPTLALNPRGGSVGVGTEAPQDRLHVHGALRILSDSNPVRFTSGWSGFPDQAPNQAEIANDTGSYKTLMLVGNKSAGGPRRVSVWDRLEVNGTLAVTSDTALGGSLFVGGAAAVGGAPTAGDVVMGAAPGRRFLLHTRSGQYGADFFQVTTDAADGAWQWGQGITLRRATGNVGIAVTDPQDRLHVNGSARLLGDANPLRITGGWSNFADGNSARAEISNDTGTYKALMIVGNASAGQGRRVGVWDRLEVNGTLATTGDAAVGGALSFGERGGQHVNLWRTGYGIGIQGSTQYFRSDAHFAWFRGGAHHNDTFNPGPNGAALMVLNTAGSLGIGTTAPRARLEVAGAIMPAAGNAETAGIMFPKDPGGGGGDSAWMRYYARAGESCTLELGIANDGDDHIALMPAGGVGIGVNAPADRLHVHGGVRILTDTNPIRFTSGWSGFPDPVQNQAEISNDTSAFKTLMIVGNKSGDGSTRRVSVWDKLEVNGKLKSQNARVQRVASNKIDKGVSDWTDMPDMQADLPVHAGAALLLFKAGGVQLTGAGNGQIHFRMLVDGSQVAFCLHEFHNNGWQLRDVSLVWMGDLAAGTRRVSVQWKVQAGVGSCCWYGDNRSLIALEL
ncbi:MAG TPA: hypothetical protein VFQ45_17885 [Longimicrobium sp.]|nr:hypothetical protein [Longimicrobium sp.]